MPCENATADREAATALLARRERLLAEGELANLDASASVSPNDVTKFYERHSVDYRTNRSTPIPM